MSDATQAFPDIEIYIKRPDLSALQDWLNGLMGPITSMTNGATTSITMANSQVCVIVENVVKGGYTSVWFKSDQTPWATDRDCALAAWEALGLETRCSNGGWDGNDEQGWRRFTAAGETIVNWFV
ncbi:MAG: hypothetical protein HQ497_02060 [SAR86 cluster bacterium]|uniref:Uncharacterized protein n=1 Tax=SAR86 cluster bacterium TaxID=2030880 RepID=A0A973A6Z0_9GAMM|nr:hypothetical protein [SAR86 cluster bacterium]